MSKLMITLLVAVGLTLTACATQRETTTTSARPAAPISKDAYDRAVSNAETQYKADKDACASRTGNAKDICLAEASGREKMAKADAEAAYKNTPKAREDARIARAEATYNVAKERCDELSGNAKDVCVKEANAKMVTAKADAKVDATVADTREDSAAKQAEARRKAEQDKRDAEYKVAIEKCDALNGAAKNTCVEDAKLRYGKS
jgi:hypothetical protein